NFEAALIHATGRPDSEIRLGEVLTTARDLVTLINDMGNASQDARQKAEKTIASDIQRLKSGLEEVATLNRKINIGLARGQETATLVDARQRIIDDLSYISSLREVQRDHGQVSLFTSNGAALLDD